MTLAKLEKILKKLKKETKSLYNEICEKYPHRYSLGVNGLGEIVLTSLSNMEQLAKGEKECQEFMKKLLEGANKNSFFCNNPLKK